MKGTRILRSKIVWASSAIISLAIMRLLENFEDKQAWFTLILGLVVWFLRIFERNHRNLV